MYKTPEIQLQLKKLLSLECNCTPQDFDGTKNLITPAKDIPGRRVYSGQKEFFSMVTLGKNAVITADDRMHDWLRIGTTLVQLLKNEVFKRGAIPFYGTSLSNLHSWNIAINCGFYPAWVQISTIEKI